MEWNTVGIALTLAPLVVPFAFAVVFLIAEWWDLH